jgi:serine phosphatase RsbU (regulator of sigma subunit)
MAETGRKGGLGFFLITKVMDEVEYFSVEGENELRMSKFFTEKGEEELSWRGGISLRVRFSLGTFLIVLLLVGGAYYFIDYRTSRYIRGRLDNTIMALGNTIASQAFDYILNQRSDAEFDELVVSYQRANDELSTIVIVGDQGNIIADSRGLSQLHQPYDQSRLRLIPQRRMMALYEPEKDVGLVVRRIQNGGQYRGAAFLEYSLAGLKAKLANARRLILAVTGGGLLIGIFGIYLLSYYFVRPIGRIVNRVRRFSRGDLDSQLTLSGAGEFYEISKALNELIMRIRRDRKNIVEREILQKEMQMAEEIQRALIPQELPRLKGFEIGTFYKAARMVGGDLFDFVRISDDVYGVVVADVSGKGIPGSLIMSMVRTALRLEARTVTSAREILIKLNDFIAEDIRQGMFVTILLAVVDTRSGKINFSSAGHNPILHFIRSDGSAQFLNTSGMPVGIQSADKGHFASSLESREIQLHEGDFVIIYTDGVIEGRNKDREPYGTERLVQIASKNLDTSASDMALVIEKDIADYTSEETQHDDMTMVILKSARKPIEPENESETEMDEESTSESHQNRPASVDSISLPNGRQSDTK